MENGCAGKIKKKKKEAEDMEQELLQEIASYWGTRAEGYSEVNEKELAGSQREAWLHVLEEQFPEKERRDEDSRYRNRPGILPDDFVGGRLYGGGC